MFDIQKNLEKNGIAAQVRIVRIFNTYGPRMALDDGRVVSNFVAQALRGEPLTVYGDGSQTRSFQYIADLVKGLVAVMDQVSYFVLFIYILFQFCTGCLCILLHLDEIYLFIYLFFEKVL